MVAVALTAGFTVTGCGGKRSTPFEQRPATAARVRILAPTPSQVTPSDVTVRVELIGGRVVEDSRREVAPSEGHLHLTLDGKQVSPASGTRETLRGVGRGQHALEAEFVAVDHAPFSNRPKAVVLFEVR